MTKDMDLVIEVNASSSQRFYDLFPFPEYYCPPIEILNSEFSESGQFNILHQPSGVKIDFMVRKNSAHAKTEFLRKKKLHFWKDLEAYVAMPEDVILKKLSYYKEGLSDKHLRDIRGILAQTEVDQSYLKDWISKLKLQDEWLLI